MESIQFVFALHDHQPVGNFDHVFAEAYDKAYLPFLELLESYRAFRAVLHHTGPLLEWIEENRPDYLERLGAMVAAGQVELLGGAFYEPILPVIPESDRVGQIVMMSDWLEQRFGVRPRGMWLAERVWEPTLPRAMKAAGIEYTLLDDWHFAAAGIRTDDTLGYFLTEDQGDSVAIFPINETLRYRIPYENPHEAIEYLRARASSEAARTLVAADDGEKFGVWPESNWHCYHEGWMYRFVEQVVNNRDWLQMRTFSEVLDSTHPLGRVYLPTASYMEMMQWALPVRANLELADVKRALEERGEWQQVRSFVRGGFWRSFFARYEESNLIHKRMLMVSRRLQSLPAAAHRRAEFAAARDHLWRAQCNCAYWHGVFGGVYLTNIRHALYRNLIAAESLLVELEHRPATWYEVRAVDVDIDGDAEILVETCDQLLLLKPFAGGALIEHDARFARLNLLDTLSRRREAYHEQLENGEAKRVREEGLADHLMEDWYRRGSLLDHFLGRGATPYALRMAQYPECGDFLAGAWTAEWSTTKKGTEITLSREGVVTTPPAGSQAVRVEKVLRVPAVGCANRVTYRVTNLSVTELDTRFGVEFTVNLLAGKAPDRYHWIDGVELGEDSYLASEGIVSNVRRFGLTDEWMKVNVEWKLSQAAEHWRFPIETVSNSEFGIERVYQGTVVMPVWTLRLAPGATFEVSMDYLVEEL